MNREPRQGNPTLHPRKELPIFTRKLVLFAITLASAATAACGGDGNNGDGGTGPGPSGTTGFAISNTSSREAWYIYSRACDTESWGEDQLGVANILYPGESVDWSEAAGCYDVLALTSPGDNPRYEARYAGRTVAGGALTQITIVNGDWAPVTDPVVASLRQVRK